MVHPDDLNRMSRHPKIKPDHLLRLAPIYIRQSTPQQVRDHPESTLSQYALAQTLENHGWHPDQIVIIDEDLGKSGQSAADRTGYQTLFAEIPTGTLGAIGFSEISRAGRSTRDWEALMFLAAQYDVLIIDADGVYDPNDPNDRLLLGVKGHISQWETHQFRQRLLARRLQKAQRGELRMYIPTGYCYDPYGNILLEPEEEIRAAIEFFFRKFAELQSGAGVARYYARNDLLFPTRHPIVPGKPLPPVRWSKLTTMRLYKILHNPFYAGTYTYGRNAKDAQGHTMHLDPETWAVTIHDHHPAYITWETFLANKTTLGNNRSYGPKNTKPRPPGPAREGAALLQGIVYCGNCGSRMSTHYAQDHRLSYVCAAHDTQLGNQYCPATVGRVIDQAVAERVLHALAPAQLAVSVAAQSQIEARHAELEQMWTQRLKQAQKEVKLAETRYKNVDPSNRLVANDLEKAWNEALVQVQRLKKEYAAAQAETLQPLSVTERQQVAALATDIPAIWHAKTTTHSQRKQLLRLIVRDVTLHIGESDIRVIVRWQNDALTELMVTRPLSATQMSQQNPTSPEVIQRIRELAPRLHDARVAEQLNAEGLRPPVAEAFSLQIVYRIRRQNNIPTGCPTYIDADFVGPRGDGRYPARTVAQMLDRTYATIRKWCREGHLDAIQDLPHGAYWIAITPEEIERLHIRNGRQPF